MGGNEPLVSIGMPAYNAERYIQQALDSLLGQDYANFELIISDNASTDRTNEICQTYLARDQRIRYYRNETNLGAVKNFNGLIALASGKYFMWTGDHDLWRPTFVSSCVSILETEPDVVLAYPQTMRIDASGNPLGLVPDRVDTRGMSPLRRYIHVIRNVRYCDAIHGLFRRKVLLQTGLFRTVLKADYILLAEIALYGTFAQITEPLFCHRNDRPAEDADTNKRRVLFELDPITAAARSEQPYENLHCEVRNTFLKILASAPLRYLERLWAIIYTLVYFRLFRFKIELPGERIITQFVPRGLLRWRGFVVVRRLVARVTQQLIN